MIQDERIGGQTDRQVIHPSKIPLSLKLLNSSGSKNLLIVTSSARPLRRRVLRTKSRAVARAEAGSRGRSLTSRSSGSPGTMDQRSKTRETVDWPWVWIYIEKNDYNNQMISVYIKLGLLIIKTHKESISFFFFPFA